MAQRTDRGTGVPPGFDPRDGRRVPGGSVGEESGRDARSTGEVDHPARMQPALDAARDAGAAGEVPVGCAIYDDLTGALLATAGNRRERDADPTAHAEVVAIRLAAAARGHWRLVDCSLYVTLEPCPMCAGAIVNARVPRVVYGCADPKAGAARTLYELCDDPRLNHRAEVIAGVRVEECADLLRDFFRARRS